jgi:hypothetical protein
MVKHFEHLWEEAEVVTTQHYDGTPWPPGEDPSWQGDGPMLDITFNTTKLIADDELSAEDKEELLGKILFALCFVSHKNDINAYTALRTAIDNAKQDMLDEDPRSE